MFYNTFVFVGIYMNQLANLEVPESEIVAR